MHWFSHALHLMFHVGHGQAYQEFLTPVLEDKRLGISVGWAHQGTSLSFPDLTKKSLGLYPVVDDVDWIEKLLKLGINTVQLRIKEPSASWLKSNKSHVRSNLVPENITLGFLSMTIGNLHSNIRRFWCSLGTRGYWRIEPFPTEPSRVLIKPIDTWILWVVTDRSNQPRSYIALGHILPTTTKQMPSKPQGLVRLALYQQLIDTIPYSEELVGYPTVAIGGIDQSTATGMIVVSSSLAVVRAITLAEDPKAVIEFSKFLWMATLQRFTEEVRQELSHAEWLWICTLSASNRITWHWWTRQQKSTKRSCVSDWLWWFGECCGSLSSSVWHRKNRVGWWLCRLIQSTTTGRIQRKRSWYS